MWTVLQLTGRLRTEWQDMNERKDALEPDGDLHLTPILIAPSVPVRSSLFVPTILHGMQTPEYHSNHSPPPLNHISDCEEQTARGTVDI